MPHYDESFIYNDNKNQRRNKRSYQVYKNGLTPLSFLETADVFHALEDRGSSVIKRNIRNIKYRGYRQKSDPQKEIPHSITPIKYKTPDIIIDHNPTKTVFDPNKYLDLKNNNINNLTPCKSFDNLILNPSKKNYLDKEKRKYGTSLQNLAEDGQLKYYSSPLDHEAIATGRDNTRKSYSIINAQNRPVYRPTLRSTQAPGPGVYRQINIEGTTRKSGT